MFHVRVKDRSFEALQNKLAAAGTQASHTLARQIAEDSNPFVPARSGALAARTTVAGSNIIYPGPYAKFLYNGKVMVDAGSGKGPLRLKSKNGAEIIRFRKGAQLKPSSKNLVMKKNIHPMAQDHWFQAAKNLYLQNWLSAAGKAVECELD